MTCSGAVRAANLKEIKILRDVLNIQGHGRGVRLAEPPSPTCPMSVYDALRKKIINTAFLGKMITELRTPAKDETRCFYWGVPRPVAIDLFLARMALLGHRILVNDPILRITGFREDGPESLSEHPWKWVKYTGGKCAIRRLLGRLDQSRNSVVGPPD